MNIEVAENAPQDWNAYVLSHADATAYHRESAVRIGASAFGLRTSFVTARSGSGELVGILPLVEQSSWIFGRFLVTGTYRKDLVQLKKIRKTGKNILLLI